MHRDIYVLDITDFRPLDSTKPKLFLDWITRHTRDTAPEGQPENESSRFQSGGASADSGISLVGAWYAVGITGHPQFRAFSLYRCNGGWSGGWREMMSLYDGVPDSMFLSSINNLRFTATTVPLVAAPGCPALGSEVNDELANRYAMVEFVELGNRSAADFLADVRDHKVQILADYGYRLAGLYEVAFKRNEAAILWTLDVDAQVRFAKARDAAVGLDDESPVDPRISAWESRLALYGPRNTRELYLAAYPGPLLSRSAD